MEKSLPPGKVSLVEENLNLVPYVIHKMLGTPSRNDMEDLIQIGNIGLIKAAIAYDGKEHKFSTFAFACIQNELRQAYRENSSRKRIPYDRVCSLDASRYKKDGTSPLTDSFSPIDEWEDQELLSVFFSLLTPRQRQILTLRLQGYSRRACAKQLKVSPQRISKALKEIGERFRTYTAETE